MAQQRANALKTATAAHRAKSCASPHYSHATFNPGSPLERGIGNQALSRLLQVKKIQAELAVSEPNDSFEREADLVADQVIRNPAHSPAPVPPANSKPTLTAPQLPAQEKAVKNEEDEKQNRGTQEKEEYAQTPKVTLQFAERLQASRGNGQPLSYDTRSFMEARFRRDLSQVRVHSGHASVEMNEELKAQAFTNGNDIYFGEGKTAGKNWLTAHELAHIAHGHSGLSRLCRKPKGVLTEGEIQVNPPPEEKWERLWVMARGMDDAAKVLAPALAGMDKRKLVLVGLHPKFVKAYDGTGRSTSVDERRTSSGSRRAEEGG